MTQHNGSNFTREVRIEKGTPKGFKVQVPLEAGEVLELGDTREIVLGSGSYQIYTNAAHVVKRSYSTAKGGATAWLSIPQFHSLHARPSDKCFRRMIIPIGPNIFDSISRQVELTLYETKTHRQWSCIPLRLEQGGFDLMVHNDDEGHYMIMDGGQPCTLDELLHVAHDAALALGYVTGHLAQTEGFCFAYGSQEMAGWAHFSYHALRDSIRSPYAPVHANAYGYLSGAEAERVHELLRPISVKEFTALCQRALADDRFSAQLLLIQESMAASLIAMPAGLCVALEGLGKTSSQNGSRPSTGAENIEQGHIKQIIAELLPKAKVILASLLNKQNEEAVAVVKKRLDNLGQPTNRSKLEAPFALVDFALNSEDIKAIRSRDKFLHGDIMLGKENVDEGNREAYYMALRLYCLLAALILKPTGYDNRIVNYPRINASVYGLRMEEEHFRQI